MPIELHQISGYSLAKMPADVVTELKEQCFIQKKKKNHPNRTILQNSTDNVLSRSLWMFNFIPTLSKQDKYSLFKVQQLKLLRKRSSLWFK